MSYWNLDFVVCRRGEMDYTTVSDANARFYQRSVTCELELEAGEYVVYVSIDSQNQRLFFFDCIVSHSREWIVINIMRK